MKRFKDQLHPSWRQALSGDIALLDEIESKLGGKEFAPKFEDVMKAFEFSLDEVKILIIGQDPYPNPEFAMGLAFSVKPDVKKLPASLKNIFLEYSQDTGFDEPANGDLTYWSKQGVMLLNRILTVNPGQSNSHADIGWREFTFSVAKVLSKRKVVAILWGSQAQELKELFPLRLTSVHPSPLSAYRGFFGSKPFTQANLLLDQIGLSEVDWQLQ